MAFCWAAKYRRLRPPMVFTTSSTTPSITAVMAVRMGLRTIIITTVPTKVREQEMRLAKLLFKASDTVSISLVYRLISSPWV